MATKPTENLPRWASVLGTSGGQVNRVEPTSLKKDSGWAYIEEPPFNHDNWLKYSSYKWLDYFEQQTDENIVTLADHESRISVNDSKSRGHTIVLASSNSKQTSQDSADIIIDISADAGAVINAQLLILNGLSTSGGSLLLMEGEYNVQTTINVVSNVNIFGSGISTILYRDAPIISVIDVNQKSNSYLCDFRIEGNKSTYPTVNYSGINEVVSPASDIFYCRIWSFNNHASGFIGCRKISACVASFNDVGFTSCDDITYCKASSNTGRGFYTPITPRIQTIKDSVSSNNSIGFEGFASIDGCDAISNTSYGFFSNEKVSGSYSRSNTLDGFNGCKNTSGCYSYENGSDGFRSCTNVSGCTAELNSGVGFENCGVVTGCYSDNNGSDGFTSCKSMTSNIALSNSGWGFNLCRGAGFNRSLSNTSGAYTATTADHGGVNAVADTATGGYNGTI